MGNQVRGARVHKVEIFTEGAYSACGWGLERESQTSEKRRSLARLLGKIVLNFSWGLGQNTNNIAEILAIWQGMAQARRLSIKKLAIIGDSRIIIQALNLKKAPNNMGLAHYHRKVIAQMKDFEEVNCYHVLQNLSSGL